jgi:hypothetical protein
MMSLDLHPVTFKHTALDTFLVEPKVVHLAVAVHVCKHSSEDSLYGIWGLWEIEVTLNNGIDVFIKYTGITTPRNEYFLFVIITRYMCSMSFFCWSSCNIQVPIG